VAAHIDYFNPQVGMQWMPADHPGDVKNLICYFSQLPAERSLLTISLEAIASDTGGHVSVGWVPHDRGGLPEDEHMVRYPIQGPIAEYTLDFTFERAGMAPPDFVMTIEPGTDGCCSTRSRFRPRRWSSSQMYSDTVLCVTSRR
jgi:hypothetical protein